MNRRQFVSLSALAIMPDVLVAKAKMARTGLVIDSRFSQHLISPAHPESPARYQAIIEQIIDNNLLNQVTLIKPAEDVEHWLNLIHSQHHIDSIKKNDAIAHHNAILATAGVLAAVDAVCSNQVDNAFCASRPPGHHAKNTGQEEGFCYYNHVAIAARYAQKKYGLKRVLIIDWDYHHGNGTEWAFYSDPDVLYFSTHDTYAYPGTGLPSRKGEGQGEGFNINVHLDCGANDQDIIDAFKQQLLPAAEQFEPEFILISAGFDSREDDLLGCHKITDHGFMALTKMVKILAQQHCQGRFVSILEGGYNVQGNASAVVAHLKILMSP